MSAAGGVSPHICDPLRTCSLFPRAKYAVNAIKKKVNDKNPHVALYALEVTAPGWEQTGGFSLPACLQAAQLAAAQRGASLFLALARRFWDDQARAFML